MVLWDQGPVLPQAHPGHGAHASSPQPLCPLRPGEWDSPGLQLPVVLGQKVLPVPPRALHLLGGSPNPQVQLPPSTDQSTEATSVIIVDPTGTSGGRRGGEVAWWAQAVLSARRLLREGRGGDAGVREAQQWLQVEGNTETQALFHIQVAAGLQRAGGTQSRRRRLLLQPCTVVTPPQAQFPLAPSQTRWLWCPNTDLQAPTSCRHTHTASTCVHTCATVAFQETSCS